MTNAVTDSECSHIKAEARELFDVAIVGAGPAGSATARRLASRGKRVALIEESLFDAPRIGESLAPAVQPLLVELGLWRSFLALGPVPSYGTRSLWGEVTPRVHSHLMNPWGCGWHIDRSKFDQMLAHGACEAGAMPFFGAAVVCCKESSEGWTLELRDGLTRTPGKPSIELRARVVIDATGRAAHLARRLGAKRFLLDHLVGVGTRFDGIGMSCEGYVLVEAARVGWWYSAPIPNDSLIVMIMTDSDLCRNSRLTSNSSWWEHMKGAMATRERVAEAQPRLGPRPFCAYSHRLCRSERHRPWFAVGDAALAVDPISGSGVVRALRSAQDAAETALAIVEMRTADALSAYEAQYDAECSGYLVERLRYYHLEQRWQDGEFWSRRAAKSAAFGLSI